MAEKKEVDYVAMDRVHVQWVQKEDRLLKLHRKFTVNPFRKFDFLPDNPTCMKPLTGSTENSAFMAEFDKANEPPTGRYPRPVTESQEIGWYATKLMSLSRHRDIFHHPRIATEITELATHSSRSSK